MAIVGLRSSALRGSKSQKRLLSPGSPPTKMKLIAASRAMPGRKQSGRRRRAISSDFSSSLTAIPQDLEGPRRWIDPLLAGPRNAPVLESEAASAAVSIGFS